MRSALFLATGVAGLATGSPLLLRQTNSTVDKYDWSEIEASPDLKWQSCFQNYTCARLIVPLDYTNTSAGSTTIAYIRQSAVNNASESEDILINPGGPGQSGVDMLLGLGSQLAQILGPQYNIVGFDPRGVNNSGPALNCFADDEEGKILQSFYSTQFIRSVDGKSEYSLRHQYEQATAFGKWCTEFNKNTDAKYANTVADSYDMTNYIEKSATEKDKDAKEAKLHYYGVSYGTILGSVYSSLFPHRMGKVVLGGVADVPNHYPGTLTTDLENVDAAIANCFHFCHASGPTKCALYENSVDAIATRTRNVLEAVRKSPIPVYDSEIVKYPTLVTYEQVDFLLLTGMYSPLAQWPSLAQTLSDVENRDGLAVVRYLQFANPGIVGNTPLIGGLDSVHQSRGRFDTYEKWTGHLEKMTEQSQWVADAWAPLGLMVKDLEIYPPESQLFNGSLFNVTTNSPILFVSNTHDPATPLPGARKMHDLFPGSGLLVQDAPGHIASLSAQSNCTWGYIGQYFATGELPPQNTTCTVESVPFITISE
ncbi:alpha/beta-hydrolase [Massarina eburnea CBS 473.64]|uniref:Alpha/beta-hydrolase n=1 Tax=Massarina eburnea CBS 473.64 TaxID=1395130 RepID=A0A6A6RQW6_9PLEO|nr:alpha/beta-hydrolase [Massarina eburnea CBS 473.64]